MALAANKLPLYANPSFTRPARKILRGYFRAFHRMRSSGQEHIPESGPVIFAANHVSYYDPMLVAAEQFAPVRYLAWDALFGKYKWFGELIESGGAIPVDVDGKDLAGFRRCLEVLREGERVIIFPEGERSYDGRLLPMREGVARLAIQSGAPLVPVKIVGAERAWPRGDFAPRPFFPISVQFLPPIFPRPAKHSAERRAESERLMRELSAALTDGASALAQNAGGH